MYLWYKELDKKWCATAISRLNILFDTGNFYVICKSTSPQQLITKPCLGKSSCFSNFQKLQQPVKSLNFKQFKKATSIQQRKRCVLGYHCVQVAYTSVSWLPLGNRNWILIRKIYMSDFFSKQAAHLMAIQTIIRIPCSSMVVEFLLYNEISGCDDEWYPSGYWLVNFEIFFMHQHQVYRATVCLFFGGIPCMYSSSSC